MLDAAAQKAFLLLPEGSRHRAEGQDANRLRWNCENLPIVIGVLVKTRHIYGGVRHYAKDPHRSPGKVRPARRSGRDPAPAGGCGAAPGDAICWVNRLI